MTCAKRPGKVATAARACGAPDRPRTAWVLLHVAQLLVAFTVLDRAGGAPGRHALLALFATTLWFRMAYRATRILDGGFSWRDAVLATAMTGTYQIGFALLGASSGVQVGAVDCLAVAMYAGGATLGSMSEIARVRFGAEPGNAARLYTRGPCAYVRYPKYVGDILWIAAWAAVTRANAAWLLVAGHAAVVALVYAPALDRRLALRNPEEFRAWASRTARLVPFVY